MKTLVSHYLAHETIKSGQSVTIRAIEPEDKPLLVESMHHLSPQSLYFRFFTPKKELSEKELQYFTELDFIRHVGLLAIVDDNGKQCPAGVARYIIPNKPVANLRAEIAFAVEEEYQGMDIGSLLLKHLTKIAREEGIRSFNCFVLAGNTKMLRLLEKSALPTKKSFPVGGVFEITLRLM